MYTHHFGLREKPFQIAPSPRFLYPSETHDESRARILYGIEDSRGFVVVYGRVGLGKTTVLLSALEELDRHVRTALVYQPVTTFYDLLRMTAHEFGLPTEHRDEVNLIWDLNEFFIQRLSEGDQCVLIVDEAQNLSLEILEKLRTLSNLQTEDRSLLQIVLVGQPELYTKLMDERLLQLRQRIGVWHKISPLGEEDTTDYILHRLAKAGARRPKELFPVTVCCRVHEWTEGVPRVINQVCDTALMITYGRGKEEVSRADIDEAAAELHLAEKGAASVESTRPVAGTQSRAETSSPNGFRGSLGVPLWARLGLGLILAAVLVGVVWMFMGGKIGSILPMTEDSVSERSLPTAVGVSEAANPMPAADPKTDDRLAASQEKISKRAQQIESWRSHGRTVYTVHLYSSREEGHALAFVHRMAEDEEWDQPIFIEKSQGDSAWYRVFAGGFPTAQLTRRWIQALKSRQVVGYARLTRLQADAEFLLPPLDEGNDPVTGARG